MAGENVIVYNSIGQKLINQFSVEGFNSIPIIYNGVVFVKIGNKIAKVIL